MIAVLLAVLAIKLLSIATYIWFVVQGFKVHWGLGVANLLIPGAIIPFCILHPKESKRPLILLVACLGVFLILWVYARHGSHFRPKVEVALGSPAPAKNAVLHLRLISSSGAWGTPNWTQTVDTGILSQKIVSLGGHSNGRDDEERLMAIQADGFVIRFTKYDAGETQTNFVIFPYGQTTKTNIMGESIVGSYSDNLPLP